MLTYFSIRPMQLWRRTAWRVHTAYTDRDAKTDKFTGNDWAKEGKQRMLFHRSASLKPHIGAEFGEALRMHSRWPSGTKECCTQRIAHLVQLAIAIFFLFSVSFSVAVWQLPNFHVFFSRFSATFIWWQPCICVHSSVVPIAVRPSVECVATINEKLYMHITAITYFCHQALSVIFLWFFCPTNSSTANQILVSVVRYSTISSWFNYYSASTLPNVIIYSSDVLHFFFVVTTTNDQSTRRPVMKVMMENKLSQNVWAAVKNKCHTVTVYLAWYNAENIVYVCDSEALIYRKQLLRHDRFELKKKIEFH